MTPDVRDRSREVHRITVTPDGLRLRKSQHRVWSRAWHCFPSLVFHSLERRHCTLLELGIILALRPQTLFAQDEERIMERQELLRRRDVKVTLRSKDMDEDTLGCSL